MNELAAIGALTLETAPPALNHLGIQGMASPMAPATASFTAMLRGGLERVNQKVAAADALVRQFAIDDAIPLHQVTFALEEARLSVEFAMQARQRMVDAYRELMNMQL